MDEYDPSELSRRHYRETLWLRDTLEKVARELERMAARGQGDTKGPPRPSPTGAEAATPGRAGGVDCEALAPPSPP